MKKLFYILSLFFAFGFLLSTFSSNAQQMKLGSNPTQIEKSAVLQMDSKNQGVLLPRVPDFSKMASTTIPDGMIVYYTDNPTNTSYDGPGLYIRKNNVWKKLVTKDENGIETINGDGAKDQTLTVINGNSYNSPNPPTYHEPTIVNDLAGNHILYLPYASNGFDGLVSNNMQTWVGPKRFKDPIGVESLSPGSIPFIGPDDYNYLSEDNANFFWDDANNKLNLSGLKFTNLFSTTTPTTGGAIGVDGSGNVVKIKGLNDLELDNNAGADPASGSGQGLNIVNTDPTKTTLNIPDAGSGVRGVVNTNAQAFDGDKTFNDNVVIAGSTPGTSGLTFTNLTTSSGTVDATAAPIGVNSIGEVVKTGRTFNNTASRQLNTIYGPFSQDLYVTYSIPMGNGSLLLLGNGSAVSLQISTNASFSTPTTISQVAFDVSAVLSSGSATLVLSGWIPKGYYFKIVPDPVPSNTVTVKGQEVLMP